MSSDRSRLHLAATAAAVVMVASALVAQTVAGADTSTSSSTISTTTSSTSTSSTTTSSTSTSTTSSTSTPPASSTTGVPGTTVLGQVPAITDLPSAVPLFIVAGTTSKAPPGTAIPITSFSDLAYYVADPSPELTSTFENYYEQGGGNAYLWLTPDEQTDTLLAAIAQIAQTDTPATLFVIPAISALDGQDYLDVASALAALADGKLGLALLDPPATAVATVRAAWPDVSALVALSGQLRIAVAAKGPTALSSTALYAAPLIDSFSGDTVPAGVVMAGIIVRQDNKGGVWVAPAGTSVPAFYLDVLLPLTNVQQEALGLGINPFRSFPNYGTVMWGSRTLDFNSLDHRYINVDRTLDWIQRSISAGLEWTVFEPNDQATQNLVEQVVTTYLTTMWQSGALIGSEAADAFTVSFDGPGPFAPAPPVSPGLVLTVGLELVHPGELQWLEFPLTIGTG